jgi:prophage regulatory protein
MLDLQVFLRISDVVRVTGLPRSTIFEMAARGSFPKQVRLSPRAVGWIEAEILAWQQARIADRDLAAGRQIDGERSAS